MKRIGFTKRSLSNLKRFDECEWRIMCEYVSRHLQLERIDLEVLGLQDPGRSFAGDSNDDVEPSVSVLRGALGRARPIQQRFTPQVFEGNDRFEWARQLACVKGLREVNVRATMENCFSPGSEVMKFFLAFSPVIETDFARWLRDSIVLPCGGGMDC